MTVTVINIGNSPNDGTGDTIRDAFDGLNTSLITLDNQNYFNSKLFNSNLISNDVLTITSLVNENTITTNVINANIVNTGGILTLSNTTEATNSTSGALVVAGGIGVTGNAYFGSNLYVSGTILGVIAAGSSSFVDIDNTPIGLLIPRDAGFVNVSATGIVTISNTNATTSNTTGALRVTGGISTAANLYASNSVVTGNVRTGFLSVSNRVVGSLYFTGTDNIFINGSPVATSAASFTGGIVPGQVRITSGIASTSSSTGALIVSGGTGIGGNLNVAGILNAGGQLIDSQGIRVSDSGIFANNTITGTLINPGQPNITTVGSLLGLTMAGNLEAGLSNQYRIGSSLSPFLRVFAFQVTATSIDGILNTASQPQVTSLGTLSNLNVAGTTTTSLLNVTNSGIITNFSSANVLAANVRTTGNIIVSSTDDVSEVAGQFISGGLIVRGGAGVAKSLIVSGDLTVKGAILATQSVASSYSGLSIFEAGIIAANVRSSDIGNIGTILTGTLTSTSSLQPNITQIGVQSGLISNGNILANSQTPSSSTTTGALVVIGGVGISGNLHLDNTGDVSANIGNLVLAVGGGTGLSGNIGAYQTFANANVSSLQNQITGANTNIQTTNANIGAYQTFANANVSSLQTQIFATNANIGSYQTFANANVSSLQTQIFATNANIISYQTFANANVSSLQNQITGANLNIQNISANLGTYQTFANANVVSIQSNLAAFQTYANSKIGTNTNSNLVIAATTTSISTDTGAMVLGGGAGISGNIYAGGNVILGLPSTLPTGYPVGSMVMAGRLGIKTNNSPYTLEAVGSAHFYGGQINTIGVPGPATGVLSLSGGNLPGATIYSVRITAIDESGLQTLLSNFSNQLTTSGSTSSIAFSWTATLAAVSYRVYVYTGSSPALQGYFTSTTNSFTLTTLSSILTNTASFGGAGNVLIRSNATSTSGTTGALVVLGSIGAANITLGGGGLTTDQSTAYVFNETASSVQIGANAVTSFNNNTQSVSSTTGAVVISGGLGIDGNINVRGSTGRSITTTGNIFVQSTGSDAFRVTGGAIVGTNATVLGSLLINLNNNATAITNSGTSGVGNIGSIGGQFNTVFAKATSAQYADLAEIYIPDRHYEPGTVVVIGGDKEITETTKDHDTRVAGVISTDPAYLMNNSAEGLPVALTGRVPCMVIGPVSKGDLLVTSRLAGVAQRIDLSKYSPGCILGKSLENIDTNEIRIIEVLVGRL